MNPPQGRRLRVMMAGPALTAKGGIATVVNNWIAAGVQSKIDLVYISTLSTTQANAGLIKLWEAGGAYLRVIWQTRQPVDVLHLHLSHKSSFFRKYIIFLWARLWNIPTVAHIHSGRFKLFYEGSSSWVQWMIRHCLEQSRVVFVLSDIWRQYVRGVVNNPNIFVLPNGAVPAQIVKPPMVGEKRVHLLFMGRLGAPKGTYDLLLAFAALFESYPQVRLTLAGDGEVDEVRAWVAQAGLAAVVAVPGWIADQQRLEAFEQCDIFVLPSYFEGMPGAVLEAMAMGIPIVATSVGGVPEAVEGHRNGFLVEPGDVTALTACLRTLIADEPLRQKMGQESFKIILEKFDIRRIVEDLVQHYETIVNSEQQR
ncbi:MAG: glycosyltransferase family 4 protein [Magnetococcus sp. DMHC-6]